MSLSVSRFKHLSAEQIECLYKHVAERLSENAIEPGNEWIHEVWTRFQGLVLCHDDKPEVWTVERSLRDKWFSLVEKFISEFSNQLKEKSV